MQPNGSHASGGSEKRKRCVPALPFQQVLWFYHRMHLCISYALESNVPYMLPSQKSFLFTCWGEAAWSPWGTRGVCGFYGPRSAIKIRTCLRRPKIQLSRLWFCWQKGRVKALKWDARTWSACDILFSALQFGRWYRGIFKEEEEQEGTGRPGFDSAWGEKEEKPLFDIESNTAH